ncbi:MAG: SGNH/GDSL hydrolase family protein [Nitrospirae bacterium]|nr:SGNH/GDSL hydrolase family protein [Magnetococcales bacterium]
MTNLPHPPKNDGSRGKNGLKSMMVTMTIILVSLLMVEGVVRLRQWWVYGSAGTLEDAYHDDQQTGLRVPIAQYESRSTKINTLGFRGPEITVPKPEGMLRLAFIGGSTTYCAEASSNDTVWPHLVWKKLQETYPNVPMDYVNAGIPGLSVPASLKDLQQRVKPLHSDVFIIYHASNDMSWEARKIAKERGLFDKAQETSVLGRYSLFWFLAEKNFRLWELKRQAEQGVDRLDALPSTFGTEFGRNLHTLIQEAKDQGGLVVLVKWSQQMRKNHSDAENLKASVSSLYYMPFMTPKLLIQGFGIYNQVIEKTALDTGSILIGDEDSIPGDPLHFNDSIHFTDAGNRSMADRVIKGLLVSEAFRRKVER